jgi:hypothetical protein
MRTNFMSIKAYSGYSSKKETNFRFDLNKIQLYMDSELNRIGSDDNGYIIQFWDSFNCNFSIYFKTEIERNYVLRVLDDKLIINK